MSAYTRDYRKWQREQKNRDAARLKRVAVWKRKYLKHTKEVGTSSYPTFRWINGAWHKRAERQLIKNGRKP